MYLNIILTIICLILISYLFIIFFIWKKIIKKFLENKNNFFNRSNMTNPDLNNPVKLLNDLMKNFPKM